jgi:very-long-chain (3R)-3-hydroxyacyl-CoA dehydratase
MSCCQLGKALGLWTAVAPALKIAQSAALFEVLHPMLGLVRSSVFTVFLQVLSRLVLLWGVCNLAPAAINNWGFAMMLLSWCAVEVPRYAFYALGLVTTNVPAPLVWLRYSLFLVLYPTGITGELLCIWAALPTIAEANYLNFPLPNALNMPFNYYALLFYGSLAYIPGAPFLFTHMIAARSKALSPPAKKEDGKKL